MSRIAGCFDEAQKQQRTLLIPYLMGGDPDVETTLELMNTMVAAGADMLELGMPFSDPMADGPVIQAASERVLAKGVHLCDVLQIVTRFREKNQTTPLILMGYANPLEVMGYEAFAIAASAAGVDGVITVDMPPEEAQEMSAEFAKCEIDPIFLLSPTTPKHRISKVSQLASGFIYYVSLKGVTGAATLDTSEVADKVARIKALTKMPVGVGFGISDAESAGRVAKAADAVIVGSVIVKIIAENNKQMLDEISKIISSMRNSIDAARS